MNSGISYYLDLAVLVISMAFAMLTLPNLTAAWQTPIITQIEDKTALDSEQSVYTEPTLKTGYDLLMSLVVADNLVPYPKSIRINDTPVIDLDNSWMMHKNENIGIIYSDSGSWKLSTMLHYKITKVEFVQNGGDPYWQYILEEVTP